MRFDDLELEIISAVAVDGAIGKDNQLLWHIPEDLQHYKNMTTGKELVVGLNTWYSLPEAAKKNRIYNVIVGDSINKDKRDDVNEYTSVLDFINEKLMFGRTNHILVAGGGFLYNSIIKYCNYATITWVMEQYPTADTYFPIDYLNKNFNVCYDTPWLKSKNNYLYKICKYKRNEYETRFNN